MSAGDSNKPDESSVDNNPPTAGMLSEMSWQLPRNLRIEFHNYYWNLLRDLRKARGRGESWIEDDDPEFVVGLMRKYAELNQRLAKARNALAGTE